MNKFHWDDFFGGIGLGFGIMTLVYLAIKVL